MFPLLSVDALCRRPASDGYREILHLGCTVFLLRHERVSQKLAVIPLGEVSALMRPARFGSIQGTLNDGFRYVQHERKLQCRSQFGVEGAAVIRHGNIPKALL